LERRSSIRSRPRKIIDFDKTGYFFPESKQPLLLNKEIKQLLLNKKEEILLQTFKKYLHDIINLEIKLISSACHSMLYKNLVIPFNDKTKLSIQTILIDEYYHVYVAQDMLLQINEHFSHLNPIDYPESDAQTAIKKIKQSLPKKYHDIFEILAVCIFETTLVKELVEFFNSEDLNPSIKHYVNDHMNDESRHFGFFFDLMCDIWNRVPNDYRDSIGSKLASFIHLYLNIESDKEFYTSLLHQSTKDKEYSKKMTNEIYKGFEINPDIPIVKNVINVLKRSGLLDCDASRNGFNNFGWKI
jgi:rubrerythrin